MCEGTSVDLKVEGAGEHFQAMPLISVSTEKSQQSEAVRGFTSADGYLRLPWYRTRGGRSPREMDAKIIGESARENKR